MLPCVLPAEIAAATAGKITHRDGRWLSAATAAWTARTGISIGHARSPDGEYLTTNQGVRVADNQNSLKAGARGPTLLEDFILREKITHFDHERIPERVVHARGAGGARLLPGLRVDGASTPRPSFLQDPAVKTPVFVRFSTVAGSRGSADTARDVRGFATKFYTEEGNFDLVGNNIPVFFIQDAIKFPDLIHAVKPEPHNEIPQAASAHDTFWDFVSLTPESDAHDHVGHVRPRHPAQLPDDGGLRRPHLPARQRRRARRASSSSTGSRCSGVHSLVWDEAQKIAGKDPDFHRRDLWEAIESGDFPEWEFGVQIDRGGGRAQVRLRPARPDQAHPGGAGAGAARSAS